MAISPASPSSSSIRRTMPSIMPAKPKTKPDWIAARLERPIAVSGASRSIRVMRAARSISARQRDLEAGADRAAEVFAVGGDDVDVDAGTEVDDDAGPSEALVGGDRVDEPVGADLERIVDPDRHPGLQPRARSSGSRLRGSARRAARTGCRAAAPPRRRRPRRSRRSPSRRARRGRRCARPARPRWRRSGSGSASAGPAPRRRRRRGGSGCCRCRPRAARRDYR